MRGKLTYRQSQYLTCFKRPNATLTCKVQHTNHFLRRRMCSSIHTSGEFGIALIKSMGRGEHARKARVAGCCPCCRGILEQQCSSSSDQPTTPIGLRTPRLMLPFHSEPPRETQIASSTTQGRRSPKLSTALLPSAEGQFASPRDELIEGLLPAQARLSRTERWSSPCRATQARARPLRHRRRRKRLRRAVLA